MEKALGLFHKDYSFHPPARDIRGYLLHLLCEKLVGFLKIKPIKVQASLRWHLLGVSHCHVGTLLASSNLSKLSF